MKPIKWEDLAPGLLQMQVVNLSGAFHRIKSDCQLFYVDEYLAVVKRESDDETWSIERANVQFYPRQTEEERRVDELASIICAATEHCNDWAYYRKAATDAITWFNSQQPERHYVACTDNSCTDLIDGGIYEVVAQDSAHVLVRSEGGNLNFLADPHQIEYCDSEGNPIE